MISNCWKKFKIAYQVLRREGLIGFTFFLKRYINRKFPWKSPVLLAEDLLKDKFPDTCAPNIVLIKSNTLRLNLLIDTLNEASLFGGVATGLIFAALLSNRLDCNLRIITRNKHSNLHEFYALTGLHGINLKNSVDLENFPFQTNGQLSVSDQDIFISTIWWTSHVAKKLNVRQKHICLLQEYEKIFYPNGDEHVKIDEILYDENIIPVINTKVLYDYYVQAQYTHITNNALVFEPAFTYNSEKKYNKIRGHKFNLFFYARPETPRNLFCTGLDLINTAIELNIIDNNWKIFFAGSANVNSFVFTGGLKPEFLGKLTFSEYKKFIASIDLGICLMLAPCPSYPPLDLASVGAVVLTSAYKNKISLHQYSENIICSSTDKESLIKNLKKSIELTKNETQRRMNFEKNTIHTNWNVALENTLENLAQMIENKIL